ncbi:MAG: hypothetical protein GX813_00495 [Erysipelotrichia bacterium]|nr:hypothetical protein [Erysipelotrichia bacterium]
MDPKLKAPIITFNTVEGADLRFANEPNRTSVRPEVIGTIATSNCEEQYVINNAVARMRVRGNYTANYRKKPFLIKFNSKTNFFGLNEGQEYKKWVLLADVKDSSLSRNALAFYLAETILDGYFVPDARPVHFYINNNYWGMYLLCESKEVAPGRVDLIKPRDGYSGTDIGYFFELDSYWVEAKAAGDPTFEMKDGEYLPNKIGTWLLGEETPGDGYTISSKITDPDVQIPYLKKRVKNTYTALHKAVTSTQFQELDAAGNLINSNATSSEEVVGRLVDIDSFVNTYIHNEICCDADIGRSSFFLSLDMTPAGNKKLTLTCPWDWDSALGLKINAVESGETMFAAFSSNPWLAILPKAQWFMKRVQTRWQQLKAAGLFTSALQFLDDRADLYVDDYKKNFEKWPHTMGRNTVDEGGWLATNEVRPIYLNLTTQAQNKDLLKHWVSTRFNYLETMFDGNVLPAESSHPTYSPQGKEGFDTSSPNPGGGSSSRPPTAQTPEEIAAAFKQGVTPHRIEAETAAISGTNSSQVSIKGPSPSRPGEVISNNEYLSGLNPNSGIVLTYNYTAPRQSQALITLGISKREDASYSFDQFFSLRINNTTISGSSILNISLPRETATRQNWNFHYWTDWDVAMVNFNRGNNSIVFTTKNSCSNLDYIDIYAK